MRKIVVIAFVLLIIGLGCKKDSSQTGQASLSKTKWTLSYIQDTKTNETINYPNDVSRKISITFSDSSNILSFNGVCNNGQGTYSLSSNTGSISVTDIFTTQIACKYDEWEIYTSNNLIASDRYKLDGTTLIIFSKGSYNLYFNSL